MSSKAVLCGIVLHPAGHTRSPAMHEAAYRALGIDARYHAFDVPPERLADAIRGARALGIRQLAVSLPHKEAVIPLLDRVDAIARKIGAVNTVTLRDGLLEGANTDWLGGVAALERHGKLAGAEAVVLGAGGTARALVFGLRERGARVTVLNRTRERADALARELGAERAGPLEALAEHAVRRAREHDARRPARGRVAGARRVAASRNAGDGRGLRPAGDAPPARRAGARRARRSAASGCSCSRRRSSSASGRGARRRSRRWRAPSTRPAARSRSYLSFVSL